MCLDIFEPVCGCDGETYGNGLRRGRGVAVPTTMGIGVGLCRLAFSAVVSLTQRLT